METELKFALSPEARDRIERHAVARSASGQATVEMDHTTYFDTADRVLRKAGFTLRVRHRNASQGQPEEYLQTVKSANDGTYRRDEWEWPIAAPWPDLGHLREVGALAAIGPGRDFEPIFHTEVRRTRLLVTPAAGAKIEMAFDDGAVVAETGDGPPGGQPVSELELELKSGGEQELLRLGLDLLQVAPLTLLNESKAERGYHLSDGSRPKARGPHAAALDAGMDLHQAFGLLSVTLLDDLLANQPAALRGEEEEGIHRMRVEIRRLRSLLVVFEPFLEPHVRSHFADELQRLAEVLGRARDWDVFLGESLPAVIETAADLRVVGPLRALAEEHRHAAHQAAKKLVQEAAFTRFVLAFRAWSANREASMVQRLADRRLGDCAPAMLDRMATKVRERLDSSDINDATSLHSLRKSAKKLRYAVEFFHNLYGKATRRYLRRCSVLQKRLGEVNDLATLVRLAGELTRDGRLDLAPALGVLSNRSDAMMKSNLKRLDRPLARFQRARPFW